MMQGTGNAVVLLMMHPSTRGTGMTNIIWLLVFCVVSNQTNVTKRLSDREQDGFVGPVKKVFVTWTPISGSPYPADSKCRQLTNEYDQMGRITRHSIYSGACGADEIREVHTYSPNGARHTTTRTIQAPNSPRLPPAQLDAESNKRQGLQVFTYDDAGRLIEERSMGQSSYMFSYFYDAKGRLFETRDYRGESLTSRRVYSYSGDDRVAAGFRYYNSDGIVQELTEYSDYEFNSQGDWIRRKQDKKENFNPRVVSITHREIEYYP
jgi:YD repeat-containing protein